MLFKTCSFNTRGKIEENKIRKLKIIALTWSDEFELSDGSYSVWDIQDNIEFIIKMHETLTAIPPIRIYINRTNNRLVFKIKDELS